MLKFSLRESLLRFEGGPRHDVYMFIYSCEAQNEIRCMYMQTPTLPLHANRKIIRPL
jgi:hypothetical protein